MITKLITNAKTIAIGQRSGASSAYNRYTGERDITAIRLALMKAWCGEDRSASLYIEAGKLFSPGLFLEIDPVDGAFLGHRMIPDGTILE